MERMGSSLPKTPKKGRILGPPQASHAESTEKANDPGPGKLRFGFTSSNHPGERREGTGNGPEAEKEPEDSCSPPSGGGVLPPRRARGEERRYPNLLDENKQPRIDTTIVLEDGVG